VRSGAARMQPKVVPLMLEAVGVTKAFGPRRALVDVDLSVSEGDVVVLVGPNGAGKTTLLRAFATLLQPTSGMLRVAGLVSTEAGHEVRQQIGYLSHRTLLYDDLTAEQNLRFYARAYGVPDAETRIEELLERVSLAERRGDPVRTFSRGMQQRLAVARTVLHRPRLLLLDEPYAGLDPVAADTLTALLTDLAEEGRTLVLTTHHLEGISLDYGRAVVLNRGRVIYDGVVDDHATLPALYRKLVAMPPSQTSSSEPVSPVSPPDRLNPVREEAPTAGGAGYLRQLGAIVVKDIAAELRTREILSAMAVYAILAMLIFSFALDLRGVAARAAAPGVLWATIAFAGTLGLSRSLAREQETGGIEGLLLMPADRTVILLGKAVGNLILVLALEVVLLPLATVLFNIGLLTPDIGAVVLLGTLGYVLAGTLLAAMAVNTRAREVMLPILLLPLVVPLLIAAVQATSGLLEGLRWSEVAGWTRLIVVYDLLMAAVVLFTSETVVEA